VQRREQLKEFAKLGYKGILAIKTGKGMIVEEKTTWGELELPRVGIARKKGKKKTQRDGNAHKDASEAETAPTELGLESRESGTGEILTDRRLRKGKPRGRAFKP